MKNEKLIVEGIGPIASRSVFDVSGPGTHVIVGRNGRGKSTILNVVNALAGSKPKLTVNDGADEGVARAFGRELRITLRRDLSGNLELGSIDPDLDPSVIVDPGIQDPEAADRMRARTFGSIGRVRPNVEAFRATLSQLLPADVDFESLASARVHEADSIVEQARLLKLDAEKVALASEREAVTLDDQARALAHSVAEFSPDEPHDEYELAQAYEATVRASAAAESERRVALKRRDEVAAAKAKLEAAAAARGGASREDAAAMLSAAKTALEQAEKDARQADAAGTRRRDEVALLDREVTGKVDLLVANHERDVDRVRVEAERKCREIMEAANAEIAGLAAVVSGERQKLLDDLGVARSQEQALRTSAVAARRDEEAARKIVAAKQSELESIDRAEAALADARELVEKAGEVEVPAPELLASLRDAQAEAARKVNRGALVRHAKSEFEKVAAVQKSAEAKRARSEMLRDAARACWRVVADALAPILPVGLSIDEGRFYYEHPTRGRVEFHDGASPGQKWRLVLPALLKAASPHALLTMRQEGWEALDPEHRREIDEMIVAENAILFVAEATDGGLAIERYSYEHDRKRRHLEDEAGA
jgi:hypothetical protein